MPSFSQEKLSYYHNGVRHFASDMLRKQGSGLTGTTCSVRRGRLDRLHGSSSAEVP
jgi:hypothetical protein